MNEYDILKITVAENNGTESGFVSEQMPAHFPCVERLSLTDLQQRVSDRHPRPYLLAWLKNVTGIRRGKGPFPLERAVRRLSTSHPKTSVVAILRKRSAGEFRKPIQGLRRCQYRKRRCAPDLRALIRAPRLRMPGPGGGARAVVPPVDASRTPQSGFGRQWKMNHG